MADKKKAGGDAPAKDIEKKDKKEVKDVEKKDKKEVKEKKGEKKEGKEKKGDKKDKSPDKGKKEKKDKSPDKVGSDKEAKKKGGKGSESEGEEIQKRPSAVARELAEQRAEARAGRWRKRYPSVTKVRINTRPWHPPPPPQRLPPVNIQLPPLATRTWVPPYRRRRRPRPPLPRTKPEDITQPLTYENSSLKKMWAHFIQVEKNKMMLQGSVGCNSKRYSSTTCGSQTACIAVVCATVLSEKKPDQLLKRDVDIIIEYGDRYYKQCITCMKCYKGKPALELNQLMPSFYLFDTKYTVRMTEVDRGLLAKHPDSEIVGQDLISMMEKRAGSTYAFILSVGDQHFYMWGNPPEAASAVRTICYIFDPHMLDDMGLPNKINGAAAFLRYAGVSSFTIDFLANYGKLDPQKRLEPKPPITLTKIEVMQKELLERIPLYELDMKTLKIHCQSEWECMNYNALIEKKKQGQYPLASLSAVSLATSRAGGRRKVKEYYQRMPREPPPALPVPPEKPPAPMTTEQAMAFRGENFFLYSPRLDAHTFGRDDLVPMPPSQTILHSVVDVADANYHSQFKQLDVGKWMLVSTRHMASRRYQTFKIYTAIACCVAAIAMLRRLRARGWNEDTLDETLDVGYNLYRESLLERGGPIRRLVLGELKEIFPIRDKEYIQKHRGIAVWGKLVSNNPKVFDLCRGIEKFFLEADTGVLQVPGELETAIWNEGGKFYLYHPWPADKFGIRVGIREGGKACLLYFDKIQRLCDYFMDNVNEMRRKPFSISDVMVWERPKMPEPVNQFKTVDTNRWVVQGGFHQGDTRFPEEHRGKQDTPISIAAIAMAQIVEPANWTKEDVDETLVRGDILYQNTLEHLERLGINLDNEEAKEEEGGENEEEHQGPTSTMAAVDVLNRFKVTDEDCIESDVMDSQYKGTIQGDPSQDLISLRDSLKNLFRENPTAAAVLTARGGSMAVWFHDDHYYFFDPHGCDKNGYPTDDARAAACLVRVEGTPEDLADTIESNLSPGSDDTFNLSPVTIVATKFNQPINAPETNLESNAYEWIAKGTAAIMMGPRGENTAIGKAAERADVGPDDMAGRVIALPAAAAFCAAAESVPPPHMHQDHMFNFLDAGAEYYLNHVKKTSRKDIEPEDLTEKFEMGANTFSIELGEPIRLPLRFPDEEGGEGAEEGAEKELGEGEEAPKPGITQMKEQLAAIWNDTSKPTTVHLLVGDYHQIGIWMAAGGKVVAFDPAPTLYRGALTKQRIKKGDELRLQRLRDEMTGEAAGDDDEDVDDEGGEGEEKPEEPQFVPPESTPVLWLAASPGEFIDKLVAQGPLDRKQMIAPYKLYPVKVTNELTSVLQDRRGAPNTGEEEAAEDEEGGEGILVAELEDAAMGTHMMRVGRSAASIRGRVAQNEAYFLDHPNRDHQDAAMAVMGIVVNNIEPYTFWKPELIDAILKYGDRLYTMSLPNAQQPPNVTPGEIVPEFHVTNFNVHIEVQPAVVTGDIKAGESGPVLNLRRGIAAFFDGNTEGVLCAKNYCVGLWRAADGNAFCYWEAHCVGPRGRCSSPSGAATLVVFSTSDELAEIYKANVERLCRPGNNRFQIASVAVTWEFAKLTPPVTDMSAVPDDGYEWKVLTAFVEMAKGRTILRGSKPPDLTKFARDALLQSSCSAIVGACMTHIRKPHMWSRKTIDEIMSVASQLFCASLTALGYEFRPGEDVLLPLQVLKRYVLGVNYVRYDLQQVFNGRLEPTKHAELNVKAAIERFFEQFNTGILWSAPHAVAIWRVRNPPVFYMLDPHACGPLGLRKDGGDDGASCVLTFTSAKLLAYAYLQNYPMTDRPRLEFNLYSMAVNVHPIKPLGKDPPLVRAPPGIKLVPATSKVGYDGMLRRADEDDRQHPPGSATCLDAQRASDKKDKESCKYKGQRNTAGWLILTDNTQYCSACHSMNCRRYSNASRGNQALPCCVMAVAMSRVEDVCRWCAPTLDSVLDSGDQLYQDSVLHFRPKTKYLPIEQILRKFYTPGNCVCRVVVYKPRQEGVLEHALMQQMIEFFREERAGVFVTGRGDIAVALFRNQRGYFMFDPADRDRYGRAVAPPCVGKARACLSCYPTVKQLVEKLGANIPPCYPKEVKVDEDGFTVLADKSKTKSKSEAESKSSKSSMDDKLPSDTDDNLEEPTTFKIYGMDVTNLRRINKHEK